MSNCRALSAGISEPKSTVVAWTSAIPMFRSTARATSTDSPVTVPSGAVKPYGASFAMPTRIVPAPLAASSVLPPPAAPPCGTA
jgi:hypothetical protein